MLSATSGLGKALELAGPKNVYGAPEQLVMVHINLALEKLTGVIGEVVIKVVLEV